MSLLKTQPVTVRNLGELLGRFRQIERRYENVQDEMAAFGAPGECALVVYKGMDRELEKLSNEIEREYGLTGEQLHYEAVRRTSGKVVYYLGF